MNTPARMKTDLDHLPLRKRRDLQQTVDILLEEFDDKIALASSARRKRGRVLNIILFGSHARGDWVEDRTSGYFSDYDLLIIVNYADFTDLATYWGPAEDRLLRGRGMFKSIPQFIVHTLGEVNSKLAVGQYFFSDIIRDGVMLYELRDKSPTGKNRALAQPAPPDAATAAKMAREYYEQWIDRARSGFKSANLLISNEEYLDGVFMLHQATERAYSAFLLTHTLYSPATHNIKTLRSMAEDMDERLRPVWPRDTRISRRRFELLKKAYVEARYSKHYSITMEELEWLSGCVEELIGVVDEVCEKHLKGLD